MKRIFLSILAVAGLLATGCQKDADLEQTEAGAEVPVTISASMEGAITRAIDDKGKGENVNRAILEVYTTGDDAKLYKRMVAPITDKTANFELRLTSSHNYDFVVWADKATYDSGTKEYSDLFYETDEEKGLLAVTVIDFESYVGNNEDRDAFCGTTNNTIGGPDSIVLPLIRPFGQINVSTKLTDIDNDNLPAKVKITYAPSTPVANTINVLNGETSGTTELEWSAAAEVIDIANVETDAEGIHLSTDYILAPKNGQALLDFRMEFINEDGTSININDNFKNIPVQRNYRTNISGDLLTTSGHIEVNILPGFDDAINKEISNFPDIASLNTALTNNADEDEKLYDILGEVTSGNNTVIIPKTSNDGNTSRSLEFVDGIAENETLIITEGASTGSKIYSIKNVYITVPSTSKGSIDINLPNSTVYINGTVFGGDVWTAKNTFVINEGAVVTNLTINKGNVEVYGKLTGNVNLGDGLTAATVKVMGDNASIKDAKFIENITVEYYNISEMPIYNANTEQSYNSTDLLSAIEDANSGDVIKLAENTEYWYTTPENFKENVNVKVLSIDKDLTIKSEGGAVIVPNYVTTTNNDAVQSTFFIENGATVTFEGLTLMSHIYSFSSQYLVNKVVEVQEGATFNMVNCTTTKNTYVDGYTPAGSGGIYGDESATINITGSTLNNSSLSAGNLDAGTFTVNNTIFDNSFVSTLSWDNTFVPQASEFVINIDSCTFQNWNGGYPGDLENTTMVRAAYGTINITNTTFPTDDEYWSCPNEIGYDCVDGGVWGGKIYVNGIWHYPND